MARQMTVTLTEEEYATLAEKAAQKGKNPETLLYEMMREMLEGSVIKHSLTEQEFEEKLYLDGLIENIPVRQPLTPGEQAERERLGRLIAGGKPMSEMVKEDRGPY